MRAFIFTLLLASNAWASGLSCRALFERDFQALNPTAALRASEYVAPNARPYRDYAVVLQPAIAHGAAVLDLGGGQGRAMSELAKRKGVDATVVNTQDFNGRYENVRYLTGWAEEILPRLKENSFDVVTDFFGAFHYSARKDLIVEGVYRALKPGGSAYFLFDFTNSPAFVGPVRFDRYLETVDASVFSVRMTSLNGRDVAVLKITKPSSRTWYGRRRTTPPIDLSLEIERADTNPRLRLAVPRVWYRGRD